MAVLYINLGILWYQGLQFALMDGKLMLRSHTFLFLGLGISGMLCVFGDAMDFFSATDVISYRLDFSVIRAVVLIIAGAYVTWATIKQNPR